VKTPISHDQFRTTFPWYFWQVRGNLSFNPSPAFRLRTAPMSIVAGPTFVPELRSVTASST